MKTIKIGLIVIILISLLYPNAWAQLFGFPRPHDTKLISESKGKTDTISTTRYYYSSKLKKDQIVNFYQDIFARKGLNEFNYSNEQFGAKEYLLSIKSTSCLSDSSCSQGSQNEFRRKIEELKANRPEIENDRFESRLAKVRDSKQRRYLFRNKETGESALLVFNSLYGGEIYFSIAIRERIKKITVFPIERFQRPQELDFMPIYPNATEFKYETQFEPMIGVGYNTHDDQSVIKDFFLRQMPDYGWHLDKEESSQGKFGFSKALMIVNPFTKYLTQPQAKVFDKLIPKLDLKGSTLIFKDGGSRKCIITVYTFPDFIKIMEKTPIDVSPAKRFGNTLIAVYYFYEEKT
ncbi:MAG: hypothetical protein JW867_05460 [Candidatus Omnitrophica bacterium]|nr:hypothetical protein [Candidatus Omnitrophota bacterium]